MVVFGQVVLQDEIHRLSRLSQGFRRHGIGCENQLFQTRRTRGVVVDADVVIDDGVGRITGDAQSERKKPSSNAIKGSRCSAAKVRALCVVGRKPQPTTVSVPFPSLQI